MYNLGEIYCEETLRAAADARMRALRESRGSLDATLTSSHSEVIERARTAHRTAIKAAWEAYKAAGWTQLHGLPLRRKIRPAEHATTRNAEFVVSWGSRPVVARAT